MAAAVSHRSAREPFPAVVSTRTTAAMLGVSKQTVYRLVGAGVLCPLQYREGGAFRFRLADIQRLAGGSRGGRPRPSSLSAQEPVPPATAGVP
jgi:excisionase family DNA binding protein